MFRAKVLKYLNGMPQEKIRINDELKGYWSSAKAAFPVIENIVDTGGLVAHPELKYKGVFDCLSVFRYVMRLFVRVSTNFKLDE